MDIKIEKSWQEALQEEFEKVYFKQLQKNIESTYKTENIFPPQDLIFNALNLCPLPNLKVVILGQDPYHGPNQAHGLSFSVSDDVKIPPSLRNIYKELNSDLGLPIPTSGNLEHWAKQGVLLLNATLTVRASEAGSHQGLGWETFTDEIIKTISNQRENVVFLLWGKFAQAKAELVDSNKHLILTAPHPSPFSAYTGFFGCKHFSKTNEHLVKNGAKPITW